MPSKLASPLGANRDPSKQLYTEWSRNQESNLESIEENIHEEECLSNNISSATRIKTRNHDTLNSKSLNSTEEMLSRRSQQKLQNRSSELEFRIKNEFDKLATNLVSHNQLSSYTWEMSSFKERSDKAHLEVLQSLKEHADRL